VQDTEKFFTAFPDWQTIIEDIIAEGDKVVVRRTVHGTHRGDIPGIPMPPTGKRVTFTVWDMYRITDGQIVERWGIHNLREQLGAV
jgi:predicted ester cyclase